jgi:hypothetical protein
VELIWYRLKWLDCYLTDKWTGRGWEYYSAVLGDKAQRGVIGNKLHQWWCYRLLNWIEAEHCEKAIVAELPRR